MATKYTQLVNKDGLIIDTSSGRKYANPAELATDLGIQPHQINWGNIRKEAPQAVPTTAPVTTPTVSGAISTSVMRPTPAPTPTLAPSPTPTLAPTPAPAPAPAPTPAPTTAPAPVTPGGTKTYTIQPGDNLSTIASREGTTVEALMQANPQIKNPNLIYAGQSLNIPVAGVAPQVAPTTPPQAPQAPVTPTTPTTAPTAPTTEPAAPSEPVAPTIVSSLEELNLKRAQAGLPAVTQEQYDLGIEQQGVHSFAGVDYTIGDLTPEEPAEEEEPTITPELTQILEQYPGSTILFEGEPTQYIREFGPGGFNILRPIRSEEELARLREQGVITSDQPAVLSQDYKAQFQLGDPFFSVEGEERPDEEEEAELKKTDLIEEARDKFGIEDLEGKVTARPDRDFEEIYKEVFENLGLDDLKTSIADLQEKLAGIDEDYATAVGNVNENPWISEAGRVGRIRRVTEEYNLSRKGVVNQLTLVTNQLERGRDDSRAFATEVLRQFHADREISEDALKIAQDRAEAEIEAREDELGIIGPKDLTGDVRQYEDAMSLGLIPPNMSFFEFVKTMGATRKAIEIIVGGESVITGEKFATRLNDEINNLYKGLYGVTNAREAVIRILEMDFPDIDVATVVYTRIPDGYESSIKTDDDDWDAV